MPHNTQWNIQMSEESTRIVNPIRNVSDNAPKSKSEKPLIALSIGDPTIDGNLLTPPTHIEAVKRVAECHKYDGYAPSAGYADTRQAVAEYWRKEFTAPERQHEILGENVFMTSGGAHAIQFAIQALCNPGDNVLIPAPGYSHYETVCQYAQIEPRFYELKQDENWECNLKHIEELTDERTKLFIMTNPSNPCGSNFSKQHVEDVVRLAEKLHVVMLADEIYAGMVFQHDENPSKEFYSVANVETQCPRVILGGTAKMYVVPGWRVAWLLVVDPANLAGEYKKALMKQTMLIVGPCTLSQGALRSCLLETPRSYYTECVGEIERSAVGFYKYLNSRASLMGPDNQPMQMLEAMLPQGALYVMVRINFKNFKKEIHNDQVFFERLLEEENVQVMPGNAFHAPGFCRIVITRRLATLQEATDRIVAFCERYKRDH